MNTRNFQKLKLSPFSVDSELFFNANYFLQSDYSTSPPSSSSSQEEEMEIEAQPKFQISQRQQQFQLQQQYQQLNLERKKRENNNQKNNNNSQLLKRDNNSNNNNNNLLQQQQYIREVMPVLKQQREIMQPYNNNLGQHQGQLQMAPSIATRSSGTRALGSQTAELITKATNNHNAMLSNVNTGTNYKNLYAPMINTAHTNNLLAEEYEKLVDSFNQAHEKEKETQQFKLPSSKSPIMEALVYCSINKYGIELKELNTTTSKISFYVSDFNTYYKHSCSICSKQSPSEDIRARMKALQRWFVTFPAWRELEYPFELVVRPSHYNKMHEIISKMVRFYENVDTDPISG